MCESQYFSPNGQTFYDKFLRSHLLPRGSWHPAPEFHALVALVRLPGEEHETLQIFGLIESCPEPCIQELGGL